LSDSSQLFRSFWMGGYEGACHINRSHTRLDLIAGTQHDVQAAHDYRLARSVGVETVRDGVRWPLIDHYGSYDFSSFVPMLRAAVAERVQVIWTLCHYGWPEELDVFSAAWVDRFARYCGAVARVVADHTDQVPFYSPINEISFLCWAAGDTGGFIHPHARGRGNELKRQLARAAVAGIDAIWAVDRRARIVHVDPVIKVFPPRNRPDLAVDAEQYTESQFEAWDMLSGRTEPQLGGRAHYLDVMGINFYHSNQWEHEGAGRLRWEDEPRDERWVPLHQLLEGLYRRYQRPICLGETSHFGSGRARWIREIGQEVAAAIRAGVPVEGVCLYPIVDRPDWDDANHWHNSGLFDVVRESDGTLRRVLNDEYAAALREAQATVADALSYALLCE
jgi:beta-glucosidase/6-phospho-beta-glucosidase/beta-galactosidase